MRFLFLIALFLSPVFLDGMVALNGRASQQAALAIGVITVVAQGEHHAKQRDRSYAVGSQAEFLKISLGQCSAVDYNENDSEASPASSISYRSDNRSSSMSN